MKPTVVPVSVVVPCYCCAGTVRRAVSSVLSQTVRPAQLILIDDASDDGTRAVLEAIRLELGHEWIDILNFERNLGPSAARNSGWEHARCRYIAFLDADDSWLPKKLEVQYAFMASHPEFAITGHRAAYGPAAAGDGSRTHFTRVSALGVLLKNPMVTPSLMVQRTLPLRFDSVRRHMEDHYFLQEAVFSGFGVARIEEVLAVIHKPPFGAGGLSGQLWAMEQGELQNYKSLRLARRIGTVGYAALFSYSLAKFCRRLLLVVLRRLLRRSPA